MRTAASRRARTPRASCLGASLGALSLAAGFAGLSTAAWAQSPSILSNLSVRSVAGAGSQTLIAGFVVGGTGSEAVLVRGDGPALAGFNVPGFLPDPVLGLYGSSGTEMATNAGWAPSLSGIFAQVGAFSLPASSKDAALFQPLTVGSYTAQISSTSGDTGVALVEVYDADLGSPTARFVNLSARSEVGTGAQNLIAGFVVVGSASETVLVRAVGPTLASFNVGGVLAAPQLTLFDSGARAVATNTGWANAPVAGNSTTPATLSAATSATFSQVGAFALPANSADCALVASLPPGAYTANVSGANGTTGVALVEIYEVTAPAGGGGPVPAFLSQPSSQTIPAGGNYTFIVSATGSAALQWYMNGSAIAGATASSYTATQSGTYDVVATNANGSTTSNTATITVGAGITSPITDLADAAGNEFYVTFGQDVLQSLGLMQQNFGEVVGFSWDSGGVISNSHIGPGPGGVTATIKVSGTVAVGPGSTTAGSAMRFEWTYTDTSGLLISIGFDGIYIAATPGQDVGTFSGLGSVLYSNSMGSEFADVNFTAGYLPSPPSNPSF